MKTFTAGSNRMLRAAAVLTFLAPMAVCQAPNPATIFKLPSGPLPKFTTVPAVEDAELYYQFFQYHQTLINANQATKAANPAQGAILDQQMATLLNVDIKELPTVVANTQQVAATHANIAAKKAAGPSKASPLTPAQQASQLEFEKVHATVAASVSLWKNLTPASWTGIHGYIAGPFKTQIYKKH